MTRQLVAAEASAGFFDFDFDLGCPLVPRIPLFFFLDTVVKQIDEAELSEPQTHTHTGTS